MKNAEHLGSPDLNAELNTGSSESLDSQESEPTLSHQRGRDLMEGLLQISRVNGDVEAASLVDTAVNKHYERLGDDKTVEAWAEQVEDPAAWNEKQVAQLEEMEANSIFGDRQGELTDAERFGNAMINVLIASGASREQLERAYKAVRAPEGDATVELDEYMNRFDDREQLVSSTVVNIEGQLRNLEDSPELY